MQQIQFYKTKIQLNILLHYESHKYFNNITRKSQPTK